MELFAPRIDHCEGKSNAAASAHTGIDGIFFIFFILFFTFLFSDSVFGVCLFWFVRLLSFCVVLGS